MRERTLDVVVEVLDEEDARGVAAVLRCCSHLFAWGSESPNLTESTMIAGCAVCSATRSALCLCCCG